MHCTRASILSLSVALLLFLSNSVLAGELWNIDCGSTEEFYESDTKLTWETDAKYVQGGESFTIASITGQFSSLRVFPGTEEKSCYTIPVGAPHTKVMVKTGFYYGNYDGLEAPPAFKLFYDDKEWMVVETSLDGYVSSYAIYITSSDKTEICLGRLSGRGDPLISYIQLAAIEPEMYPWPTPDAALSGNVKYAFGSGGTIRSPDDPYDRWWSPINSKVKLSSYSIETIDATVYSNTVINLAPTKIFSNAIAPKGSENLTITTSFVADTSSPIYVNLYFTETSEEAEAKRLFVIYRDDQLISEGPITLIYGAATIFSYIGGPATTETTFTLVPTAGSTLPPVISGFELFHIRPFSGLTEPVVDGIPKQNGKILTLPRKVMKKFLQAS